MTKIYLSPSNQNGNLYSGGNTNEMVQCNKIADSLKTKLANCGFDVKKAPQGQAMTTTIAESNSWGADLHLCIHTNAFNGSYTGGTMCMVYSNSGDNNKVAKAMLDNLAPITPGSDYAIQTRPGLRELCDTSCTALYTEVEFHDTAEGAGFIINSIDKIADCMCKAVCSFYNVSYNGSATAIDTTTQMYRVRKSWTAVKTQVGAYRNLDNAKKCCDAYAGYFVYDKDGKQVYASAKKDTAETKSDVAKQYAANADYYIGYHGDSFIETNGREGWEDWCCDFVTAVAYYSGISDLIPLEGGTGNVARYGVPAGRGTYISATDTPQVGDIINYRWSGRSSAKYADKDKYYSDHIAIVTAVIDNTITATEGNANGTQSTATVCRKTRTVGQDTIAYYYRPAWDKVSTIKIIGASTPSADPVPNNTSSNVKTVQQWCNKSYGTHATVDGIYGSQTKACLVGALQCIIGCTADGIFGTVTRSRCPNVAKGAAGDIVYVLQGLLICNGYKLAFDGEFGTETYNAVCAYQKTNNLSVDGIAGPNTFAKLCS